MRLIVLILSSFIMINLAAQNTDYIVSTAGIGPFKLGMSKAAVEKILGTKIQLPQITKDPNNYGVDTIKCKYKDFDLDVVFMKSYYGSEATERIGVSVIMSSSPLLKTKSGMAVGDDKMKIFKTYDQYRLLYLPDWDKNPKKSEVHLYDNETANVLVFYLYEGRIAGLGAMIEYGD